MPESLQRILLVFAGGGVGSVARYLVQLAAVSAMGDGFPLGTLAVNVVGSFLLAIILYLSMTAPPRLSADTRIFLGTGVMGGFTTYSSFNAEAVTYFRNGAFGWGLLYMGATIFGCLAAGALGIVLARAVVGGP